MIDLPRLDRHAVAAWPRGCGPKAARLAALTGTDLPIPDAVLVPSGARADAFACAALGRRFGRRTVVVRSAFTGEDGAQASLAGAYRSILGVPADDPRALADAIAAVRGSATTPGVPRPDRADVLVQVQVAARTAGVAFTEPDHEDDLVEFVAGLADRLVGGVEPGTRIELPRCRPFERPRPAVDGPAAAALARLAALLRQVRRAAGDAPWDVEWADDGRRCWLVQIRPIVASPGRDEAFTVANHKEILPEVPSRLMAGILAERAADLYAWYRQRDPRLPAHRPFLEVFHGRPRINLSLLLDTVRRWGLGTRLVTRSIGGDELEARPPDLWRMLGSAPALLRMTAVQARPRAAGRHAEHRIAALQDGLGAAGLAASVDILGRVYVELVHGMFALTAAMSGPLALLRRLGVADPGGSRKTVTTELLLALRAARARLGAATDDPELRAGRSPGDPAARAIVADLLERFGHRGVFESDVARPRFVEDPTPLLRALSVPSPEVRVARPAPWWAAPLLAAARVPTAARERLRSEAMRAFAAIRARLLTHADALVGAGRLPDREALFDLEPAELRALDEDPNSVWTARRLAERRAAIAADRAVRLPDLFRRRDLGRLPASGDDAPPPADRARGLGLGRGRVEGVVWLAVDPLAEPPDGDQPRILVAPAIDAGWIPAISLAAGVVVETGGELSHGSIVLREAGIPAVTNVAGAMRAWRPGQRVRLDAATGTVEPLSSA